jgi:hypothetical protein
MTEQLARVFPDQAEGLREILRAECRFSLPLISALPERAHDALVARLDEALAPHGCRVQVLDGEAQWNALGTHEVAVALGGDFEAATAAYALVKAAVGNYGRRRFQLLFAGAPGRAIVSRFVRVADYFLDVDVRYAGVVGRGRGRALQDLAQKLAARPLPESLIFAQE